MTVDGKPAELLRCNFIMRGVLVPAGAHSVEFDYQPPHQFLFVTIAAFGVAILFCGILLVASRRKPAQP